MLLNEMGQMKKGFGFRSTGFEMLGRHPVERPSLLLNIPEVQETDLVWEPLAHGWCLKPQDWMTSSECSSGITRTKRRGASQGD